MRGYRSCVADPGMQLLLLIKCVHLSLKPSQRNDLAISVCNYHRVVDDVDDLWSLNHYADNSAAMTAIALQLSL